MAATLRDELVREILHANEDVDAAAARLRAEPERRVPGGEYSPDYEQLRTAYEGRCQYRDGLRARLRELDLHMVALHGGARWMSDDEVA